METNMDNCQVVNHPFKCVKCSESFKSVTDLAQHFESAHDFPFKCMLCSERFSQISLAEEHFIKVHEVSEDPSSNEENKENQVESLDSSDIKNDYDISIMKVKEPQKNHKDNNHVISVVKHKESQIMLKPEKNHVNPFGKPHEDNKEKQLDPLNIGNDYNISIVKVKETQKNREYVAEIREKSFEKEAAIEKSNSNEVVSVTNTQEDQNIPSVPRLLYHNPRTYENQSDIKYYYPSDFKQPKIIYKCKPVASHRTFDQIRQFAQTSSEIELVEPPDVQTTKFHENKSTSKKDNNQVIQESKSSYRCKPVTKPPGGQTTKYRENQSTLEKHNDQVISNVVWMDGSIHPNVVPPINPITKKPFVTSHPVGNPNSKNEENQIVKSKCPQCEESFLEHRFLIYHLSTMHGLGSSNWKCYICKASFSQYGLLTLHRQREHNETTPKQKNIEVEWNMVSIFLFHFRFLRIHFDA